MGSTEAEWHRVGDSVQEGGRIQARVKGRPVTVLRHHGKLFGIDSMCYHGGGPLGLGDIEEIDGKACLNCSWHHYKITIEGGEKLYQSTEFNKVAGPPTPLSLANLCCCGLALCRFDHTLRRMMETTFLVLLCLILTRFPSPAPQETKKLMPAGWKSVGQKQRVHLVEERDSGVFVQLVLDGEVESDKYSDCNMTGNLMAPGALHCVPACRR